MKRNMARFLYLLSILGSVFVGLVVLSLLLWVLWRGISVLDLKLFFGNTSPLGAILGKVAVFHGIFPALIGTFWLVILSLLLAVAPGIGCGIYLSFYASPFQKWLLGAMVDILAGIPSVIMGLFGFLSILWLKNHFLPQANSCLLLAACCLALLVLPTLITTTKESLLSVPQDLMLNARALGIPKGAVLWYLLLPQARNGILSGAILALGRVAEDTAVVMFVGAVANAGLPNGLFGRFESLSFYIYYNSQNYQTQLELQNAMGASLVLLCLCGVLLLFGMVLKRISKRKFNVCKSQN
ncbi:ABC transporter permease subunit [Helicobacter sp. MIT 05-5294]|uniref:PstA family ABC transporter permease n=1 Tax=Helicobacter sp. MIT 05-5294 TaxID=1548150 RepID=UPI00051FA24A|nr:ABC transporter permease subunit [Helicobacter sp. MIT 05-5294]TLD86310.1 ABC transporter permease subunit [Helicobacter sp. MIT 05-5294]